MKRFLNINSDKLLIIFEFANNHMGDIQHGLKMIKEYAMIARDYDNFIFGFKFQFRHIKSFIHTSFYHKESIPYIKRFKQTALSTNQFETLVNNVREYGHLVIATAFDEKSVDLQVRLGVDIIKIASCSTTDWPLLETIKKRTEAPIIISTATSSFAEIDKVVSFFYHSNKEIAIMHCIAEYPTLDGHAELNQISIMKDRYVGIPIGYSTHENPENTDNIKIAFGKGARIFEKHVAIESTKYNRNLYSAYPEEIHKWLDSLVKSVSLCGMSVDRYLFSKNEIEDITKFKRGVYSAIDLKQGDTISNKKNITLNFPNHDGQLMANDLSGFNEYVVEKPIINNQPIYLSQLKLKKRNEQLEDSLPRIKELLMKSKIIIPKRIELEFSHHIGVENFLKVGLVMFTLINNDKYCKKILVLLPGQRHPEQYHKVKDETFLVIYGSISIKIDGKPHFLSQGDIFTIHPDQKHAFQTDEGAVIEEISSTHLDGDSYYTDKNIMGNKNRKTKLTRWI